MSCSKEAQENGRKVLDQKSLLAEVIYEQDTLK